MQSKWKTLSVTDVDKEIDLGTESNEMIKCYKKKENPSCLFT